MELNDSFITLPRKEFPDAFPQLIHSYTGVGKDQR